MNGPLTYRSLDGKHYFTFTLRQTFSEVEVYCSRHPSLNGRDDSPSKTHIFSSGKLCFVDGRAPTTIEIAKQRAKQWAEYLLEYIHTGTPQS